MKQCPILVKAKVFYKQGSHITLEDNWWIKKYCFGGKCPLETCVYEQEESIKEEDMKKLKEVDK